MSTEFRAQSTGAEVDYILTLNIDRSGVVTEIGKIIVTKAGTARMDLEGRNGKDLAGALDLFVGCFKQILAKIGVSPADPE